MTIVSRNRHYKHTRLFLRSQFKHEALKAISLIKKLVHKFMNTEDVHIEDLARPRCQDDPVVSKPHKP